MAKWFGPAGDCTCTECTCEIFQADFDLRYVLDEVPVSTSDWVNATRLGINAERLVEISAGSPGEGLIFAQPVGMDFYNTNKQRYWPEYSSHPDPAPIRALNGFNAAGLGGFNYKLVSPAAPGDIGFYRLTNTTLTGPAGSPSSLNGQAISADWPTYWRNHFDLYDGDGIVTMAEDSFPFELQTDEYLQSKRQIQPWWAAMDLRRLFYWGWSSNAANTSSVALVRSSSATPIFNIRGLVESGRHVLEVDVDGVLVLRNNRTIAQSTSPATGYWCLWRNNHADLSPSGSGNDPYTNSAIQQLAEAPLLDYSGNIIASERLTRTFNIPFSERLPSGRVKISVGNSATKLGSILLQKSGGPRLETWPRDGEDDRPEATNINPDCVDRPTCPLVYPYQHVTWHLRDLQVSGMTIPAAFDRASVECNRRIRNIQPTLSPIVASVDVPFRDSGGNIQVNNSRQFRNFSVTPTLFPNILGLAKVNRASSSTNVDIRVHLESNDAQNLTIKVYLFSGYVIPFGGEPSVDGAYTSGTLTTKAFRFPASAFEAMINVPNDVGGTSYVIDPSIPLDGADSQGWWTYIGTYRGWQVGYISMRWVQTIPKFELTSMPTLEFSGEYYDFTQTWEYEGGPTLSQSRYIRVLRELNAQAITAVNSNDGTFEEYGEVEEIDLSTVRLTIGPPL
jgi:hypothetical protein